MVYVFSCNNSTLQIKGKVNSIIVGELPENRLKVLGWFHSSDDSFSFYLCFLASDNCKKLGLVFENVVGIVEIINSKAIQLQVRIKHLLNVEMWLHWLIAGQTFTSKHIWNLSCFSSVNAAPHTPANRLLTVSRCWEEFPPFPSIRQRAARSTWARIPWTVPLSVRRALRWTSWYHMTMNMWVDEGKAVGLPLVVSECVSVFLSLSVWISCFTVLFLLALQREFPVPEQFKTVWDGSKLVTEPTEIAGW